MTPQQKTEVATKLLEHTGEYVEKIKYTLYEDPPVPVNERERLEIIIIAIKAIISSFATCEGILSE